MRAAARVAGLLLLAGIFLWAAGPKLLHPAPFAGAVAGYELLPPFAVWPVALYLPWLEAIAALALMLRQLRISALLVLGALTLVFTAALISAWARGLQVDCGCFGAPAEEPAYAWWITRDLLLAGLIAGLLRAEWRALAVSRTPTTRRAS